MIPLAASFLAHAGAAVAERTILEARPSPLPHAAHGAALAMLAVILLTMSLVVAFGIRLFRRARAMRQTQALLDSLDEAESFGKPARPRAGGADDENRAAWEKPADWWKE